MAKALVNSAGKVLLRNGKVATTDSASCCCSVPSIIVCATGSQVSSGDTFLHCGSGNGDDININGAVFAGFSIFKFGFDCGATFVGNGPFSGPDDTPTFFETFLEFNDDGFLDNSGGADTTGSVADFGGFFGYQPGVGFGDQPPVSITTPGWYAEPWLFVGGDAFFCDNSATNPTLDWVDDVLLGDDPLGTFVFTIDQDGYTGSFTLTLS